MKFIGETTLGGVLFMLWLLITCTYYFGILYKSSSRFHNIRVLAVDNDDGVIGQSVRAAYQQLKAPGFLTLEFHSPEEYPTEDEMFQAVWQGDFWGAVSVNQGASARLEAALQGGQAAATYNPRRAINFIWNGQYYPAYAQQVVFAGVQTLIGASRLSYNLINGTQASTILDEQDPAALQAFLNPIAAMEKNIQAASFGASVLLNTIGGVTPVLSQFFFLLVLAEVMHKHHLFSTLSVRSSLIARRLAGLIYGFGAALCQTAYTFEFRENWDVNGNQFVLSWMTYWLVMTAHELFLETIITLAPMQVMSFVVLAWGFLNSTTMSPLELQAGFFHWGVALPGHNAYLTLHTIWSGGARNRLYRTLPILFTWVVVGLVATTFAHFRACHLAYKVERGDVLEQEGSEDTEMGQSKDGVLVSRQIVERDVKELLE